ncbi:MAG: helicase-related protein, partial [Asticcacaulis sp.]
RLLDLFDRSKVMLNGVSMMVIDEADRMLDMGFIPDIERIFKLTPPSRQTLFFSATMPPEITRLTEQFLKNPVRIEVSRPATTGENIAQYVTKVPVDGAKAKRMALRALIARVEVKNGIVFCNRKTDVDIVAKSLKVHGFDAAPIHGDLDQSLRTKTLESFRNGELTLLVASDVAARGLDIPDVGHVFNFEPPHHADDYVHRIGRTGRAGRSGEAYLIVGPSDVKNYDKVLKLTKKEPQLLELEGIDWSEAEGDAGGRRDRKRGRPESRGAEDRPARRRGKQEDKPEAQDLSEAAPARPHRNEVSSTRDRPPEPRVIERDSRENGSRWRRDRDGDFPVQGFGDMIPAFMRRTALPRAIDTESVQTEVSAKLDVESVEAKPKAKPKPRVRKKKTSDENVASD